MATLIKGSAPNVNSSSSQLQAGEGSSSNPRQFVYLCWRTLDNMDLSELAQAIPTLYEVKRQSNGLSTLTKVPEQASLGDDHYELQGIPHGRINSYIRFMVGYHIAYEEDAAGMQDLVPEHQHIIGSEGNMLVRRIGVPQPAPETSMLDTDARAKISKAKARADALASVHADAWDQALYDGRGVGLVAGYLRRQNPNDDRLAPRAVKRTHDPDWAALSKRATGRSTRATVDPSTLVSKLSELAKEQNAANAGDFASAGDLIPLYDEKGMFECYGTLNEDGTVAKHDEHGNPFAQCDDDWPNRTGGDKGDINIVHNLSNGEGI